MYSAGSVEATFIANGKAYGYTGESLRSYVESRRVEHAEQIQKSEERKARMEERDSTRQQTELLDKITKLEAKVELAAQQDDTASSVSAESAQGLRAKPIKIPKYDAKQTVESYLELFEDVANQNQYEVEELLIRLRVALAGSKLESACYGCETFADAKRELLTAFGKTADKAWQALIANTQKADESFYQFVVRVSRDTEKWRKLAMPKSEDSHRGGRDESGLFAAMVRQVILEAIGPDMKAFMIEKRCYEKDLKAFTEDGMAYQTAHGRKSLKVKSPETHYITPQHSAQCLGVSVEGAEKELATLAPVERRWFVARERLCYNCLRVGHQVKECQSKTRCKCGSKHHPLLHWPSETKPPRGTDSEGIRTYSCTTSAGVHLMTGVAEVCGSKRARVRVFIDPGSQASFISASLASAIRPSCLSTDEVKVTAFGTEPVVRQLERLEVVLTGTSRAITIRAWKNDDMRMKFPPVAKSTIQQWQASGIELSDQPSEGIPNEVHLLIGADHCNEILKEKKVVNGETAWSTEIGWVLCGPTKSSVPAATVSVGCIELDRLWRMEEVPERSATALPDFLLEREGPSYQVGLLWKAEKRPPDNLNQAMAAAQALVQQLQRKGKRQEYDRVLLEEYAQLDAIEKEEHPEEPGYYMPHHAVFRSDATTTKTRVVFNASASRSGEQSLNDLVDPGPSLLPDLVGLLLRFREYPVAFQADIRKAFFMIGMRPEDRPYLRFVWPEIGQEQMCIWRLKKLPFGVNCSPFILSAVLRYHLDHALGSASAEECAIIKLLLRSFYVDDCVSSVPCSADAEKLQEYSMHMLQGAGMELRKWRGNTLPSDPEAGSKALGIVWATEEDVISVADLGNVDAPSKFGWSRRALLRCVAAVYDPLGWASPAILPGKFLLQECWKLGGGWDDPLPSSLSVRCAEWWGGLADISAVRIPRWLGCPVGKPVFLHMFADASEKGYGCCLYVVTGVVSSLLFAKAKVAPVARPTLARLELQAVCLAAKVLSFVVSELRIPIERIVGWTDSLTTWHWISKPSYQWKTYVANRVAAVQEVSRKLHVEWRHCPGVSNPADLVSRGVPVSGLQTVIWLHGPPWLSEESEWPQSISSHSTQESAIEARVAAVNTVRQSVVWPWENLSKWQRARGVVVRMLQWKEPATRAELFPKAEAFLYRSIQQECFAEEIAMLKEGNSLPPSSRLYKLSPFLDDAGLLRVGGRLQESELGYDAKHPIILAKHHLTELLLEMVHKQRLHQGVESVLAFLQRKFWILSGRRLLRSVTERCFACRWFKAKAAAEVVAPLPADRVEHQQPFGLTGIDYAGPLYVQTGERSAKRWVVLFVCGTTRAVHLDMVDSLSTEAFLLVYRRFVARRGKPCRIRSDNATTFKAAAEKIEVVWSFNPPAAPWFGGFYERLVACVKTPLKKVLGKALLKPEELATVLAEIEAVVNSRPLTSVSTDIGDDMALTPAMMMGDVFAPGAPEVEDGLTAAQLSARFSYIINVKEHLRKRWREQYLVGLSSYQSAQARPIKAGEVVLVVDDKKKRHLWRLGRVIELFAGRDGKSRVARVKVGNSTMLRAIPRLVPLEVASEPEQVASEPEVPIEQLANTPADEQSDPVSTPASPDVGQPAEPRESPCLRRSRRAVRIPARLDL